MNFAATCHDLGFFAEGKDASAQDSESDADSCRKSGSPGSYEELNSQTQRVLRGDLAFASSPSTQAAYMCMCNMRLSRHADGAKCDTIGQGQAIQRQALSGVLGKILSRKDAVAMR